MTTTINASTSSGLVVTPDNSGNVLLQYNGQSAPAFSAYKSADQTGISSNTATKVTFDTENFDTNSNFASSRFTPTVAGYYQVSTQIIPVGTGMTNQQLLFYKNGAEYTSTYLRASTSDLALTVSTLVYLNGTTDYMEVYGKIIGSSSLYFASGASNCWFTGCLLRGA